MHKPNELIICKICDLSFWFIKMNFFLDKETCGIMLEIIKLKKRIDLNKVNVLIWLFCGFAP